MRDGRLKRWIFIGVISAVILSLAVPALAVDDGLTCQGDVDSQFHIPTLVGPAATASAELIEMGGLGPERIYGLGPEQTDRREQLQAASSWDNEAPKKVSKAPTMVVRTPLSLLNPRIKIAKTPIGGAERVQKPRLAEKVAAPDVKRIRSSVKRPPKKFGLRATTKFWAVVPMGRSVLSMVSTSARADQQGVNDLRARLMREHNLSEAQATDIINQAALARIQGGQGGQGNGGGGQGGGGGGGGQGGGAGEALTAAAALIAAASPAVIAAIDASARKSISATNAGAQVAMTQIAADTTIHNANAAADVAYYNMDKQAEMNSVNQKAVTERLGMTQAVAREGREQAQAFEEKKFENQVKVDSQMIELAKMKLNFTNSFTMAQAKLQAMINGLSYTATGSRLTNTATTNQSLLAGKTPTTAKSTLTRASRSKPASQALLASARKAPTSSFGVTRTTVNVQRAAIGGSTRTARSRALAANPALSVALPDASRVVASEGVSRAGTRSFKGMLAPDLVFSSNDDASTHHD